MFPSSHQVAEDNLYISETPLNIIGLLQDAHHPAAGAIVLFSGEVRERNADKSVEYLEYEAQASMASKMIKEIIAEAKDKWKLNIAIAQHRTGKVRVGESAVVVITASPHRREAYVANQHIIDRIKHEVPIWKCEYFTDGTKEWGGNCNCHQVTGDVNKHVYDFEQEGLRVKVESKS